jgi:hypothetical protein
MADIKKAAVVFQPAPATTAPQPEVKAATIENVQQFAANVAAEPVQSTPFKKFDISKVMVPAAVILLCIGVGSYMLPRQEEPSAAAQTTIDATTIKDQNYQLELPKGWQVSSDYTSGAGVNIFYQPGEPNVRKSRMTVFVSPKQATGANGHVKEQISSLGQNGGVTTKLTEETILLDQHVGTFTTVKATSASNPDEVTYYAYLALEYGDTQYNVDVMSPDLQWQNGKDAVIASVKSFRPTAVSVTHR